ncbi:MAG: hypothetical protein F4X56_00645 [Gammaproteobacteria bacterium]|nr:hypothetical protein [Gammaproteobacteria bacterium]MYC24407.1 hypothetical protein [Gammaproteobacteria bacterium]
MLRRFLLIGSVIFYLTTLTHVTAEVLDGPRGPVEFIGLEEWTPSELYKAIQETDPDKPFHACAAVMISELKFPAAAAFGFIKQSEDGAMEMHTVVIGVEKSEYVRYRTVGSENPELPETWQELQTAVEDNAQKVSVAAYVGYLLAEPETAIQLTELSDEEVLETSHEFAEMFGANAESFDLVSKFIDELDHNSDHELALQVHERTESWSARFVATIVLAHFHEKEVSWHALAESLIDPARQVRDVAGKLLEGLVRAEKAVPVQWSKVRETLLAILGGTNPWEFNRTLDALVATEIDSKFAREIVREKPKLILDSVGVDHDGFTESAHQFLTTISNEDFERDVEAWSKWILDSETESDP